jgi:hypothetical protein
VWEYYNFNVKIKTKDRSKINSIVSLFFDDEDKKEKTDKFTHYGIFVKNGVKHLVLFKNEDAFVKVDLKNVQVMVNSLPYKMDIEAASDLLMGWLNSLSYDDWGKAPDCDGSCEQDAFCIESNTECSEIALILYPVWAEYHK